MSTTRTSLVRNAIAAVVALAAVATAGTANAGTLSDPPISGNSKSISKTFGKDDFSATVGASSKVTAYNYAEVCAWVNSDLAAYYKSSGLPTAVSNVVMKAMRDQYCKHAGKYQGTGAKAGARAKIMGHSIDVAGLEGWAAADYNLYDAGYKLTVGGNTIATLRIPSSVDQDFAWPMTLVSGTRKFMVGPVPVYVEGEAVGSIGVRLQAQFGNSQVEGTLTPHAGIDATFGCGVGVDFAKAGIQGELNLVTLSVPATGFINWGNAPKISYGGDITATITSLDGSIKLGAWLFGEEVGSIDIFSWTGFEYKLTQDPLYQFSGSFSL